MLKLSKSKLYDLVARMEIAHVRIGGAIRFLESDIEASILENRVEANGRPRKAPRRPKLNHIKLS